MKNKILFLFLAFCCAITLYAQSDTTRINAPLRFDYETIITKSGKASTKYYAIYNGEIYDSNKTSMKRYYTIRKFGGQPCAVLITNKKSKAKKIIVL